MLTKHSSISILLCILFSFRIRFCLFDRVVDAGEKILIAVACNDIKLGLVGISLARSLQFSEEILRIMTILREVCPDFKQVFVVYRRKRSK